MAKESVSDKVFGLTAVEVYKLVLKGELKKFPDGFWQLPEAPENAIAVTRYMFEEVLSWTEGDIIQNLRWKTFVENKLNGMLNILCGGSAFKALDAVYPTQYHEWELVNTPRGYWTKETKIKVGKWFIEEKLKWDRQTIVDRFSTQTFRENDMMSMYLHCFNGNPFKLLEAIYPGEYQPWELTQIAKGYWTRKTAIKATRWLVEEKLKLNPVADNLLSIDYETFMEYGLGTPLHYYYSKNPKRALTAAYPYRFGISSKDVNHNA